MLVDTSFVIDLLEGEESAVQKRKELKSQDTPLVLPPGVVYELYTAAGEGEMEEIDRLINAFLRVPLTVESEKEAARIRSQLLKTGDPIKSIDYLIAGVARDLDQKILTADDHFEGIERLKVEKYR